MLEDEPGVAMPEEGVSSVSLRSIVSRRVSALERPGSAGLFGSSAGVYPRADPDVPARDCGFVDRSSEGRAADGLVVCPSHSGVPVSLRSRSTWLLNVTCVGRKTRLPGVVAATSEPLR